MKLTRLRAVIYAGFVLTGMVTTLLGPVLPVLASRWSLDDPHAGYLFTTQFLGSMVGVGLLIVPRFGFTHSLAHSYVLLRMQRNGAPSAARP
jgi:MFS family permease